MYTYLEPAYDTKIELLSTRPGQCEIPLMSHIELYTRTEENEPPQDQIALGERDKFAKHCGGEYQSRNNYKFRARTVQYRQSKKVRRLPGHVADIECE